ncbi:MAG: PAS domain-containing sensor histidine kinase [Deltaproteobacteria bacterium]|nr:PAS domain-containing sensor histidine kinase [Deltaproteobacteria bacterium]
MSPFALALLAAAVPAAVALPMLWLGDFDAKTRVTLTLVIVLGGGGFAIAARERVVRPLQTLANLIAALRERDYSVRGRPAHGDPALALAMSELAGLAEQLRAERWRDEETAAGLARVVESLDAAVLAVDDGGTIRIANRTAERLVGKPLVDATLAAAGLEHLFAIDAPRTVELALPGGRGTWEVRPSRVRLSGRPHRLVVMTDVQHALRAEERQAWQRLVRVLGHEINNSLGPIASIAETLRSGLAQPRRDDFEDDLARGLEVIERRAAALARFMQSYARLVRLPPPRIGRVDLGAWIRRTADLETRAKVVVADGPALQVAGDPDQLDQLLINLVHNAAEASAETGGAAGVRIAWTIAAGSVVVVVEDDGPGVADTANLFVPFFTTKPTGSGIGLVLARQIAEAHGGSITLRNRTGARGAEAIVTLPAGPVR